MHSYDLSRMNECQKCENLVFAPRRQEITSLNPHDVTAIRGREKSRTGRSLWV